MRMVMDHGINFPHGGVLLQSFCNQHVVSFQPNDAKSTTGVFLGDMNTSGGIIAMAQMVLTGNASTPNNISPMISTGNPPSNILLDPLPGLKHHAAFAVGWSFEELEVLKRGLVTFAGEPNIMKYVKIAARLPEKTVRDVAIRCRWMTLKENGKQHKSEDFYAGKKIKDRKEKMIGCSSMVNMHYNQPDSEAACSVMMYDGNHINQFSSEAFPVIDSRTKNLLEDNAKLLHQIAVNSENNEIQNNIDLLYRTNNNITAILNSSMLEMPGIMSQMPPLPVYANENLLHSILRATSQAHGHGNSHLQEEPSCW